MAGNNIEKGAECALESHLANFRGGLDCRSHELFGARFERRGDKPGVLFRVWAPNAQAVAVTGTFNGWETLRCEQISEGVWETFTANAANLDSYEIVIQNGGRLIRKADPFAFCSEERPLTASRIFDLSGYEWGDGEWMAARAKNAPASPGHPPRGPLNIYSLHPGSWRRGENGALLTYSEIAGLLTSYVKDMGYTHIGLTPMLEHTHDDTWGFLPYGFFCATSRFGAPHGFMELVDQCHRAGIGVIMDWTPGRFESGAHGLAMFDGGHCFEARGAEAGSGAGSGCAFDLGRREVCSFLASSAMFWIETFHLDGLRLDGISNMLYPDRLSDAGRPPDIRNAREDTAASAFVRRLNRAVSKAFPDVLMIAEQSFPGLPATAPPKQGGLGFSMKWNTDWQNDALEYIALEAERRPYAYERLAATAQRAFSEWHILPLSHREFAHPRPSLVERIPGGMSEKFSGARVILAYMTAHPGKKLLFMGCEYGQLAEWNSLHSLDWHLLGAESHRVFKDYVRALNRLYLDTPALWEGDFTREGFVWLCGDDPQGGTLAFYREAREHAGGGLAAVFNFSTVARIGYRMGVPRPGVYHEIFNSDSTGFGGSGAVNGGELAAKPLTWKGLPYSIKLNLPPHGAVFLAASE